MDTSEEELIKIKLKGLQIRMCSGDEDKDMFAVHPVIDEYSLLLTIVDDFNFNENNPSMS